ncbi:hypothetical protein EJP617_19220 [Erwinia sp. Ejp617]|nr:hypothetical protein EJP617_19220 [Erwinia sp. Ejp617]
MRKAVTIQKVTAFFIAFFPVGKACLLPSVLFSGGDNRSGTAKQLIRNLNRGATATSVLS